MQPVTAPRIRPRLRRYCFYWMFYQDGTIEYEIKLTGELSTNAFAPGEDAQNPGYGTLVDPGVNAQVPQGFPHSLP